MTQEIFNQRSGIIPIEFLINKKTEQKLRFELNNNSTANDIRIVLAMLNKNQEELANELEVTPAAVSLAMRNDPWMKKLRKKIICHLNKSQGYRKAS